MIEGLPGSSQPGADTMPTTFTPSHLPGSDDPFPIPASSPAPKPKFHLWRSAGVVAVSLLLSYLVLGSVGALAFLQPVTDFFTSATGINESVLKEIVEPISGKIKLDFLPVGHGNGLDADTVDSKHAEYFATSSGLDESNKKLAELSANLAALDLSPYARSSQLSSNALTLNGREASFYLNAANLGAGTLQDDRLSANVVLLDLVQTFSTRKIFADGLTVSGGTLSLPNGSITSNNIADGALVNVDISSTAAIAYSKINLSGAILGSDLAANIFISTTGNLVTTGSGAVTSAGSFSGPSSANTINGLIINAGALSGVTTLNLSGAISGATSSNTINGLVFSSGNATLANLTSSSGALTSTVVDSGTAVGFVLGTSTSYVTSGAKLLSLKNNSVEEFAIDKDGNLTANGNIVATGTVQGTQLISTVLTGTAPLVVSSTTQVANLNASFIDGYNAAQLMSQPQPNLVLNSDFGRRNKWMTFMPEVFSDTSGWTAVTGTLGTVASNVLTSGTAANWLVRAGLPTWRDGRFSGQFKFVDAPGSFPLYMVGKIVDADNWVMATWEGSSFTIRKKIAGTMSSVGTVVSVGAVQNQWYWLELEAQGTIYTGKLYSSGGSPVTKVTATTLIGTVTATIADTALAAGYIGLKTDANNTTVAQWGGLSTGDGGVYVEGWGPESWMPTFSGTKGGQAIGFDETADAGPTGKQWSIQGYIPATSRQINLTNTGPNGGGTPSQAYVMSGYVKTSGTSGAGGFQFQGNFLNSSEADQGGPVVLADSQQTTWTRLSGTATSTSGTRRLKAQVLFNPNSTTSGTYWAQLVQMEYGSTVTPWRNAPADDGPITWQRNLFEDRSSGYSVAANASWAEINPNLGAANIFLPWDAGVEIGFNAGATNDGFAAQLRGTIDGTAQTSGYNKVVGTTIEPFFLIPAPSSGGNFDNKSSLLTAGKHRIAIEQLHTSGTLTLYSGPRAIFWVTATRGK